MLGEVPSVGLCVLSEPSHGIRPTMREMLNKSSRQHVPGGYGSVVPTQPFLKCDESTQQVPTFGLWPRQQDVLALARCNANGSVAVKSLCQSRRQALSPDSRYVVKDRPRLALHR